MATVARIMKQAKDCKPKQEQLLKGKFMSQLQGLSEPLKESAMRHWDRLIWNKSGMLPPADR